MDGGCYVPNNPQYGLQLECQWPAQQIATGNNLLQCNDDAGATTDPLSLSLSPPGEGPGHCWPNTNAQGQPPPPPDDMGSFSMPLDLDPLPTLFPFSPCSNHYKSESNCSGPKEVKPTHDMADVLLSLKHAVVHPGQAGNGAGSPTYVTGYTQQPQLSYTVHPHQMLMSPTSAYSTGFCDQLPPSSGVGHQIPTGSTPAPMFPSMSVNVSMNMTYHHPTTSGYAVECPQMQWSTTPQGGSPGYIQNQNLLSPTYPGATYSFTADFRPPVQDVGPLLPPNGASFKPVLQGKAQFSPVRTRRHLVSNLPANGSSYVNPGKTMCEEDGQRPNLCRICGKTYARPSTLKTHLRTHSGEKPYRCLDCNKSFSQAANLTAHVRTHSGEKPFRCPICDRRFSQSSSVTTHMRTHSGERPYRCRMCKKAFSDSSTLTKHLRIHSGEKPYQCKLCLLRFSQSGNLNRHMRVHGTGNTMLV